MKKTVRDHLQAIPVLLVAQVKLRLQPEYVSFVLRKVENLKSTSKSLRKGGPTKNAI